MKKKVLITGGTGLVGSAISDGIKISSKDVDLRNFNETLKLFKKISPTHIIHTAARVGGILGNTGHNGEFFYDNIMINTNVLEAARLVGTKRVVSYLSTCIFPNKIEYPLTEKKIFFGEPHDSNYGYSYAKRMGAVQSKVYNEQYGTKFSCIIPSNIYGPHDNFDLINGHVLPALIHKCYLAKKNNTDFIIWGSGEPLREFIYSKDIAKLSEMILNNDNILEPLIVTTGIETSIKDVAIEIAQHMNFTGNIIFDSTKPDGQFRKPSSNLELLKYFPNFKFTKLTDGIKKTIKWFNENYENTRK